MKNQNYSLPLPRPSRKTVLAPEQLRQPNVPDFPFSSPINEEMPTPFESQDSPRLIDMGDDNPFERPGSSDQHQYADGSAYATQNGEQGMRQTDLNTRKDLKNARVPKARKRERPELNIITDFTTKSRKKPEHREAHGPGAKTFVGLNDLQQLSKGLNLSKPLPPEPKKQRARRKPARKGYTEIGDEPLEPSDTTDKFKGRGILKQHRKGRLRSLRLSPEKAADVSPSDRAITIGMRVPCNAPSALTEQRDTTPKRNGSIRGQRTPVTPTIVVTPAADDGRQWSDEDSKQNLRPRPASSVYSQPTPRMKDPGMDPIPPVPSIPASHAFVANNEPDDVFLDQKSVPGRQRAFSTVTVFEDTSPPQQHTRPRSFSDESKRDMSNRYSIDTVATKHRSQGWWNYLLSPLLSRSNTVSSPRSASRDGDKPPPLPFLFVTSPMSKKDDSSSEKGPGSEGSWFSPDTPYGAEGEKGGKQEEEWPNMDEWAAERERSMAKENLESSPQPSKDGALPTNGFDADNPTVHGLAAEYYQACAHDLFSPEPFFECINHLCPGGRAAVTTPALGAGDEFEVEVSRGNNRETIIDDAYPDNQAENQNPNNPFFQQFCASVRSERDASRPRSFSNSTLIDDEPGYLPDAPGPRTSSAQRGLHSAGAGDRFSSSPYTTPGPWPAGSQSRSEQRQSHLSSPSIAAEGPSSSQPPPYSPPKKRYRAIFPPDFQSPQSPGPLSPDAHRSMASRGSIPMSDMGYPPQAAMAHRRDTYGSDGYPDLPPRAGNAPVTWSDIEGVDSSRMYVENRRRRLEREDAIGRRAGGLWRGRGCFSNRGCFGRPGREGRNRRRWYIVITGILLAIIIASVVLATTLRRKDGDETPVQSRWLNLTGYPPIPTGISTIAGPDPAVANSGCIKPSTMWSCALPKEQQDMNKPYNPDQPNFRLQISFKNGTYDHSTTVVNNTQITRRSLSFPSFVNHRGLVSRGDAFDPDPSPPSMEDQIFLGNTTDNVTFPFAGEETPFFVSFISPAPVMSTNSRLARRSDNSSSSSNPFPNLSSAIPDPAVEPDGTASPANLYPLPKFQPLRLYDRGKASEHYGFYTYFDRSIFLKSSAPLNASETSNVPDDENGGSSKSAARVRCTWAQTRFLVQIYTKPQAAHKELKPHEFESPASTTTSSAPTSTASANPLTSSSATDFTRPGSFPYPVTITLDRHGGNADAKMVYCYGLDTRGRPVRDEKKLQLEFRGFGGTLVNPAAGVFNLTTGEDGAEKSKRDEQMLLGKGVDGGSGGCGCEWRNWVAVV